MINVASKSEQNPAIYLSRMPMETIQKQQINFSNDNEWDICYKYSYPYNVLCNFSPSSFVLDEVSINSMEGFLQSLKIADPKEQRSVCQLPGFLAKKVGNYMRRSSQYDGVHLYWNGRAIDRNSKEYQELLNKAYKAKFSYDKDFREILGESKGRRLTHKIGKTAPEETVLTEEEFISHLDVLRQPKTLSDVIGIITSTIRTSLDGTAKAPSATRKLSNLKTTFINSHTMCGEDVFKKDTPSLKELKKAGVKNVIQIGVSENEQATNKNAAQSNGINYFCLNFPCENPDKFANEDLINLINMLNSDEISYICCEFRQDCNPVLAINYLFNPKASIADSLLFGAPRKKFVQNIASIITKNITPETKMELGWNETFEEGLQTRKTILQEING